MSFLSKGEILGRPLKTEVVDVPEWGGIVRVRELTAKERCTLGHTANQSKESNQVATYTSLAVCMGLVDDAGNQLFSEEELNKLLESSGQVIDRLYNVIARLSGLIIRSKANVEDDAKN
jgi:hypothetical protein